MLLSGMRPLTITGGEMSTTETNDRGVVEHRTVAESVALGKAARKAAPRSSHADWEPTADRPDPVAVLESQAKTRVPELVPIRYGRMMVTPFTFYRGAALVMAGDLADTPDSGLRAQLCGDAHLTNFGLFASPERRLLFDLNDFDETLPGPWEWDLKRLVASMEVAGRSIDHNAKQRHRTALATVTSYREAMRGFAAMSNLEVFYSRLDVNDLIDEAGAQVTKKMRARFDKTVAKAHASDSTKALRKLTRVVDGEVRIVSDPPLIEPLSEIAPDDAREAVEKAIHDALRLYRSTLMPDRRRALEGFRFVELARKVVGVGSVGTRAWIALLFGRDEDDPLFLQFKEAEASVLERFVGASTESSHGARVVAGQRLMQAGTDIFLGSTRVNIPGLRRKRDFYVRQLKDWKGSFDPEGAKPEGALLYGRICGWTLARAHARSGDRIAIAAYLGSSDTFDRAIAEFARLYADQNERDHAALLDAVAGGRVEAETGL
jgi:uncharacterized protein (DUF2252 family)